MDWDDLKFFYAVANSETLSAAANKLGVNQTTVSRRLQHLQDQLGVRLLNRTPRGMEKTNAGDEVFAAAEELERIVADLERRLYGQDERLTGDLRVTTIEYMAAFESPLFIAFKDAYPGVDLGLTANEVTENLRRHEADVAIRWTNHPSDDLVGRKLCRAEYALYESTLTSVPSDNHANPDLESRAWLSWDEDCDARITHAWMRRHVPKAPIQCRTNSAMAMFHGVKAGMGIGFLPCAYADPDPQLRRLRPVEPGFGMDVWILTHPELRGTVRVKAFTEHAVRYFDFHKRRYAGLSIPVQSGSQPRTSALVAQSEGHDQKQWLDNEA